MHLPYEMQGVLDASGNPVKGHDGEIVKDANGVERYYVSYYIHDDTGMATAGMQVKSLQIQMLEPDLTTIYAQNDASWVKTVNTPVQNKLLATFAAGARKLGTYRTVFTAVDSYDGTYRDHKARPTLTKNDPTENEPPLLINTTRNGDRVVSAKVDSADDTKNRGEKELTLEIPQSATVRVFVKRKLDSATGSVLLINPATGSPVITDDPNTEFIALSKTSAGATVVAGTNPVRVRVPFKLQGNQVSDKARNLFLEFRDTNNNVIGYDYAGKTGTDPWYFTVFQVEVAAFFDPTVNVNSVLPPLAMGAVPGSTSLLDTFKQAAKNEKLGHQHYSPAPVGSLYGTSYDVGGIVLRGKIVPSSMAPGDFNTQLSRTNAFNWVRKKWKRTYNGFDRLNNHYSLVERAVDEASDDPNDSDEDLSPGIDWPDNPQLANERFIWVVDTPTVPIGGVNALGGFKQRIRFQAREHVEYAGKQASRVVSWYWRASQEKTANSNFAQSQDQPGDNIVSDGETVLTPGLGPGAVGAVEFTLDDLNPTNVIPQNDGTIPYTITGAQLRQFVENGFPDLVAYAIYEAEGVDATNIPRTELLISEFVLDLNNPVNADGTAITGYFKEPDAGYYPVPFKVKVFIRDKGKTAGKSLTPILPP